MLKRDRAYLKYLQIYRGFEEHKKKPINVILILAVLNQRYNKTLGGIDLLTYTESRAKQRNQRINEIHQLAGRKEKQTITKHKNQREKREARKQVNRASNKNRPRRKANNEINSRSKQHQPTNI